MNILITGADGLLGSNTVRELLNRGYAITALIQKGKNPKTIAELPIQLLYGDILNQPLLIAAMKDIDAVIHCAASTSIWPARSEITRKVNIEGTNNIITACLQNKVKRLIYVGTANSFGSGNLNQPGTEDNPYKAAKYGLDYMDSKRIAQENVMNAVKEYHLPAIVVNPTFMIGPFDSGPSSGAMILALLNGKVPCFTKGGKNYINVKDAAVGIVNALTMGEIGQAYILGNENLSFREMFEKIGKVVGAEIPKRSLPSPIVRAFGWLNSTAAGIFNYSPDVSYQIAVLSCEDHYYSSQKAIKKLCLPQTPIENGILDCFDWFKKNGTLKINIDEQ